MTLKRIWISLFTLLPLLCLAEPEVWSEWKRRAVTLWPTTCTEFSGQMLVPRLLPSTQQPAPVVLILGKPDAATVELTAWLHRQAIHVVFLDGVAFADTKATLPHVQRAIRLIRFRSAEWQIDSEAVALLACDPVCGTLATQVVMAGEKSVYASSDRVDRGDLLVNMVILLNAGDGATLRTGPEATRPELFTATGDSWHKPLAAWLDPFKSDVF